jgi:hypothetical protein
MKEVISEGASSFEPGSPATLINPFWIILVGLYNRSYVQNKDKYSARDRCVSVTRNKQS